MNPITIKTYKIYFYEKLEKIWSKLVNKYREKSI